MAVGYFLRVGDSTTCGGKILTGDPTFSWYGVSAAREGDTVSCGKHSGIYKVTGGVVDTFNEGQLLAGSLNSLSSCPCRARFIPSIQDSYTKESSSSSANTQSVMGDVAELINNLWISFTFPKMGDFSGLKYRLTMSDGSIHEGTVDKNNKITLPSVSATSCACVEIEKPDKDNNYNESITSQLLSNIMG